MRRLILGTAGHIDHGKSTLVRALTGGETDRLEEERRRGITIDLGFARLALPGGTELGVVDVPGHEAFIRNMLAGATGIDLVLLVVAADEGVMPQTREHLAIVDLLGVRGGVVAITKTDLVDPEWLELVLEDVRGQLEGTPFAESPVVPVSAETGTGLDELVRTLETVAGTVQDRRADDLLRIAVDRVFSVRGTGTVVTGTVWSGQIAREQTVRLLPAGRTARVRGVQVHGQDTGSAQAGQRAAVALAGLDRLEVQRGEVVVSDPSWQASSMLTVRLRLVDQTEWTVRQRQRVRFHLGTAEVMARVVLLGGSELEPGQAAWAQLRLEAPVVARSGDRFVIRSYSPVSTIGGGWVVEPAPAKRKRLDAAAAEHLRHLLTGGAEEAVLACIEAGGWGGLRADALAVATRFSPAEIEAALERLGPAAFLRSGERLFGAARAAAARALFLEALEAFHDRHPLRPGMDREELRRALPAAAAPELGAWVLGALLAEGSILASGSLVARAGFRPRLSDEQVAAKTAILDTLREAGLTPPTLAEFPPALAGRDDFRPLLRLLEQDAAVVGLTAELYLARSVLDEAIGQARQRLAGRGPLGAAEFREVFPVSRKFLIPLLEYLDRTGITTRRGDQRQLDPA